MNDVTSDDKLWAALSWAIPLVAIIMLLMEEKKDRAFIKYHAIHSLAFSVLFFAAITVLSICTMGFGGCLGLLWFVAFYWAFIAYQGSWVEIPMLTDFIKQQGMV
ncbi:hypothetical protein QUF64_09840 [Anaerolineales bacterium HSG6]|nr:hypothetical protein [Anaerolineales bacterium HSG6]